MTERRDFIKKSSVGTVGIAIGGMGFSSKSYASIIGANDRIFAAVVGIGGRGGAHVGAWCTLKESKNITLKTLCDVDELSFSQSIKTAESRTKVKPSTEWDMRRVFEDKEINVVSFATPNFWHALGTVWACQAGKHVYVEKPACWSIFEGRKMVEASNKYDVRVQVGHQNRSSVNVIEAIKFLHDGGIGDVFMARGLCIKPRDSFGISPDSTPPPTLHYDNWLGPVAYRPYNEKKGHYNWHWFWETGNGDTGNQGPHQFDIARWGLNKNEHPVTAYSIGGFFGINPADCAQETPNTQSSVFKYSDGKMLEFETRGRYSNSESTLETKIGNIFFGTEGFLELNGDTWKAFRKREKVPFAGSKPKSGPGKVETLTGEEGAEHFANFIDAIWSGKDSALNCSINEGHYSAALPHLANISHRLGRGLNFNGATEKFVKDPEADAMLSRKEYRKPYIVPDKV
ncbi:MAG: Gfo/Idh/MocA family oxidoreductase [Mariniphaga sp.]